MLDFSPVFTRQKFVSEVIAGITAADLPALTTEIYDAFDSRLEGLTDTEATFVAQDPTEDDPEAEGWNVAHVIVHLTAGLEEWAAVGATLARGVEVTGRSRYETPWEAITTAEQVHQRMAESRRISFGYLSVWPDEPHLDTLQSLVNFFGSQNAVASHLNGYMHATMHLTHIGEIRRQAAEALGTVAAG
jgi:DinB superfamily